MKLIIRANKIVATGNEFYEQAPGDQDVLDAPDGFDHTKMDQYVYDPVTRTVSLYVEPAPPLICELDSPLHQRIILGQTVNMKGRIKIAANGAVVPITWTFALPTRASDGREKCKAVPVTLGEFDVTWEPKDSGFFTVDQSMVNRNQEPEERMTFPTITFDVME